MTKKYIAIIGAAILALSLSACGVTAAPIEEPIVEEGLTSPEDAPVAEAATTPEPAPKVDDMIFAFGETIEYDDGIGLSVSAPSPYTPSEYAAVGEEPNHIVFNVKVTNGSTEPYEPGVYGSLASGGAEASQIFDTANGIDGGPMTAVLPGQTVEWPIAYGVIDPADLTFQVSPGSFVYDDAIFTTLPH